MNESKDKKTWLSWRKAGWIWLVFFGIVAVVYAVADISAMIHATYRPPYWLQSLVVAGVAALLTTPFVFLLFARWAFAGWRNVRRIIIGVAILATLVAAFYTEENWRGKRAWEDCKRELEAKGAVLDWDKYIPPPVPDDQNFFKAPKMSEWFVKNNHSLTNELRNRLGNNGDTTATNLNEIVAAKYLAWSDQFEPDFDLIREALKRPYARMGGDYSKPYAQPIPNFVAVRDVAQVFAQRAKCYLLLGQPDKALQEVTLLHDMRRLLEAAPTGKPMTLVSAMINVAVTGLYVDTIASGLQSHTWQEPQLVALQEQLQGINLASYVHEAFKEEQIHAVYIAEKANFRKLMTGELFGYGPKKFTEKFMAHGFDLMPQGWVYQNLVVTAELMQRQIDCFDPANRMVFPSKLNQANAEMIKKLDHYSIFNRLAAIAIPNYSKALQTFARNQTHVNEAQIVCALERYYLKQGEYPETLGALVPQLIEKIPCDIIGGEPLHYRRTGDGKILLYSVGWNETDDGGLPGTLADVKKGDWVWQYPVK